MIESISAGKESPIKPDAYIHAGGEKEKVARCYEPGKKPEDACSRLSGHSHQRPVKKRFYNH
jgi:hypothetical protein